MQILLCFINHDICKYRIFGGDLLSMTTVITFLRFQLLISVYQTIYYISVIPGISVKICKIMMFKSSVLLFPFQAKDAGVKEVVKKNTKVEPYSFPDGEFFMDIIINKSWLY